MPKKELLKWGKVALTYGAETPVLNCSLESEEARQKRRRSRTSTGGIDSSGAQRPPAFMGAVVEDGRRPGEQTLREQASAESMAEDLAWTASTRLLSHPESEANMNAIEYERDLLERLQPRANTAGPTAGTDGESPKRKSAGVLSIIFRMANRVSKDPESLPSGQRHTSSSFEQQLPELRSKLSKTLVPSVANIQ